MQHPSRSRSAEDSRHGGVRRPTPPIGEEMACLAENAHRWRLSKQPTKVDFMAADTADATASNAARAVVYPRVRTARFPSLYLLRLPRQKTMTTFLDLSSGQSCLGTNLRTPESLRLGRGMGCESDRRVGAPVVCQRSESQLGRWHSWRQQVGRVRIQQRRSGWPGAVRADRHQAFLGLFAQSACR